MDQQTWQQVKSVFYEAIELSDDARSAYLDTACVGKATLRAEVESLLDSYKEAEEEELLAAPTSLGVPPPGGADAPGIDDLVGTSIGPYRLLESVGEGGFGKVYRAEQEEPVRRIVALKLIKLGMDTEQVIARFEAERQTLAMMTHPGIARVLDAGATATGRPFFVMEYVDGVRITDYCDGAGLNVNQRLELFLATCRAVQHAHQKGIIHRDIKPSNVLVTERDDGPMPTVIDFGIAKAIREHPSGRSTLTGERQLLGTPDYMSPEQAQMDRRDVDTRSDVYSLGALLYELLAGRPPFGPAADLGAEGSDLSRLVREVDPPRPSARVESMGDDASEIARHRGVEKAGLIRLLRGDLDWIVMKAMEKDRALRYDSASALAEDIQRFLSHEPVVARPPAAGYRLRKFVRRNRISVTAGLIVLAAVILGVGFTTWGFVRAVQQRDRAVAAEVGATREATKAQAISRFLHEAIAAADPEVARGRELTVRELLDRASSEIAGAFSDQPEVEASLRHTMGAAYHSLNETAAAEEHLIAAIDLYAQTLGEEHPDALRARSSLAQVREDQGRSADAEIMMREVLQAQQSVLGEEHPDAIRTMNNLAWTIWRRGRAAEAEPIYRRVVQSSTRVLGPHHEETLRSMASLAGALIMQGELTEADGLTEDALARARDALGDDHPVTIHVMEFRAWLLYSIGRYDETETLRRELYETSRRVFGEAHVRTVSAASYLAWMLSELDKLDDAERLASEALEACLDGLGEEHPQTLEAMNTLATIRSGRAEWDEAAAMYRRLLELRRRVQGNDHPSTLETMNNFAVLLWRMNDLDGARRLIDEALEIRRRRDGDEHPETLKLLQNLGLIHLRAGRDADAEAVFARLLEIRRRTLGPDHPKSLATASNLSAARASLGRIAESIELGRETYEAQSRTLGALHSDTLNTLTILVRQLRRNGDVDEAIGLLEPTVQALRDEPESNWGTVAQVTGEYGATLSALPRYAEAEHQLLAAVELYETAAVGEYRTPIEIITYLIELYEAWGKPDAADEWRARLSEADVTIEK